MHAGSFQRQWLTTDSLIAPLGDHRKSHIQPSKGKKRKRKSKDPEDVSAAAEAPPPPPEIGKNILVGINSVTRHLEALAARSAPKTVTAAAEKNANEGNEANQDLRPLSMVILTRPKPSISPAYAHIPTLVHLASLQPPSPSTSSNTQATRLIPLASSTDARLASALHIPRVAALAIFADAPGTKALEAFVQENVDVTECKWIDEAMSAEWKCLNVKTELATLKNKSKTPTSKP